ncbi:hypothetical protein C3943_02270 [Lysinibacillus sp. B2A1]|nr:hypothetical protein C3943_02270 [Lysinibacillus sp. B2A1]
MITFFDIKNAVNAVLQTKLPQIKVKAQDITKGFERPSLTTEIEDAKAETLNGQIEMSCTVLIYYFPDLKNTDKSIDVLDMQFRLPIAFGNKLYVANRALNINEPSSKVVDGILIFQFDILFYQADESNAGNPVEMMQELYINLESE